MKSFVLRENHVLLNEQKFLLQDKIEIGSDTLVRGASLNEKELDQMVLNIKKNFQVKF